MLFYKELIPTFTIIQCFNKKIKNRNQSIRVDDLFLTRLFRLRCCGDILRSEACEGVLGTKVPDADVRTASELHLVTAAQPRLQIQTIL